MRGHNYVNPTTSDKFLDSQGGQTLSKGGGGGEMPPFASLNAIDLDYL